MKLDLRQLHVQFMSIFLLIERNGERHCAKHFCSALARVGYWCNVGHGGSALADGRVK